MDCGVAALVSLLKGYGQHAEYGVLRERCQTGLDGTSIDAMEDLGVELGLDLGQHLVPAHDLTEVLRGRLPAIVLTRSRATEPPHFVVLWRVLGPWVHVMDPARGRYWELLETFLHRSMEHVHHFEADGWRDWYESSSLRESTLDRCRRLLPKQKAREVVALLTNPKTAAEVCAADGALRFVSELVETGASRGTGWNQTVFERAYAKSLDQAGALPARSASLTTSPDGKLSVACTVALAPLSRSESATGSAVASATPKKRDEPVVHTPAPSVWRELFALMQHDARKLLLASAVGVLALAVATAVQFVAYRAAYDAPTIFVTFGSRLGASSVFVSFLIVVLLLETSVHWGELALGRYLEARLRALTFGLLPNVNDTFIRSRPTSDLAYRAHGLSQGRGLPSLMLQVLRAVVSLLLTSAALIWINWRFLLPLAIAMLGFWLLTVFSNSWLRELDLKLQLQGARLLSLFLDALRGFRPVRLHGYQPAFRDEQNRELENWRQTSERQFRARAALSAIDGIVAALLVGSVFLIHVLGQSDPQSFVLVAFWTLRMPSLMSSTIDLLRSYPSSKTAFTRTLEITKYAELGSATSQPPSAPRAPPVARDARNTGVRVDFADVTVVLNSNYVLRDIRLHIPAGQHVAVVGPSGSGKSSLLSLLLGFLEPSRGEIIIDRQNLSASVRADLRDRTAWVDPAVQLHNRSFVENLDYAAAGYRRSPLLDTLESSQLLQVLETLEHGMETAVGSDGRLLSGGEGQRLRLGRALLRADIGLALLDEPFRGLERSVRMQLATRARLAWKLATMIFVSHDISHAMQFERVLVVENGRIVEDGHPLELAEQPSRFRELLRAERALSDDVWSARLWRRLRIDEGTIRDHGGGA